MYNVLASEDITKDHKECSKRASNGQPYLRTSAYSCKYFLLRVLPFGLQYMCVHYDDRHFISYHAVIILGLQQDCAIS